MDGSGCTQVECLQDQHYLTAISVWRSTNQHQMAISTVLFDFTYSNKHINRSYHHLPVVELHFTISVIHLHLATSFHQFHSVIYLELHASNIAPKNHYHSAPTGIKLFQCMPRVSFNL